MKKNYSLPIAIIGRWLHFILYNRPSNLCPSDIWLFSTFYYCHFNENDENFMPFVIDSCHMTRKRISLNRMNNSNYVFRFHSIISQWSRRVNRVRWTQTKRTESHRRRIEFIKNAKRITARISILATSCMNAKEFIILFFRWVRIEKKYRNTQSVFNRRQESELVFLRVWVENGQNWQNDYGWLSSTKTLNYFSVRFWTSWSDFHALARARSLRELSGGFDHWTDCVHRISSNRSVRTQTNFQSEIDQTRHFGIQSHASVIVRFDYGQAKEMKKIQRKKKLLQIESRMIACRNITMAMTIKWSMRQDKTEKKTTTNDCRRLRSNWRFSFARFSFSSIVVHFSVRFDKSIARYKNIFHLFPFPNDEEWFVLRFLRLFFYLFRGLCIVAAFLSCVSRYFQRQFQLQYIFFFLHFFFFSPF